MSANALLDEYWTIRTQQAVFILHSGLSAMIAAPWRGSQRRSYASTKPRVHVTVIPFAVVGSYCNTRSERIQKL